MYLFDPSRTPSCRDGAYSVSTFSERQRRQPRQREKRNMRFSFFRRNANMVFPVGDSVPFLVVDDLVPNCRDGACPVST